MLQGVCWSSVLWDVPCNVRSLQEIKHASPILYATTIRYYGIAPESQCVRSSPPSLPAGVLTQVAAAALASLGWEFRL